MQEKKAKRLWRLEVAVLCTAIFVFILLWRFPEFWAGFKTFLSYFETILFGGIIAYIINPFTEVFMRLFRKIKNEGLRRILSIILSFGIIIALLAFLLVTLVPQIVNSIENLISNFDGYTATINNMLSNWELTKDRFDLTSIVESSEELLKDISDYISDNSEKILGITAGIGKGILQWFIALIVAIYLIFEKPKLKAAFKRLLKALFPEEKYESVASFLSKCNTIMTRYIVFSLLDAVIVGVVNFIFMVILGMENAGLVSVVVAATNLVPTFGPIIGALIGGFIILMTDPVKALIFIIFTLVLQLIDGYILKPKMFGDTFGVSGLLIVAGVIIGGSMFGIIGILLAIPGVAVLDYIYKTYIITRLERRRVEHDSGRES